MNRNDIKKYLNTDIEFVYHGKGAAFCPLNTFVVGFDGEGRDFKTLDEAIDAKVFDGKSLVEFGMTFIRKFHNQILS